MAQAPVAGPLAEADLGDELGLDPGDRSLFDLVGERRCVAPQRLEALLQILERRAREAGADLAGVAQALARVVADEERAEDRAAALRRREAADHELLLGRALELEPVAAAAVDVRGVGALGDQPLPAMGARVAVVVLAVRVAVRGEADVAVEVQRSLEHRLAR